MISKPEWNEEEKYLNRVMKVIEDDYEQTTAQCDKRSGELNDYRKYLWENRRDFNNLFEIAEYEDRLREDLRGYEVSMHRKKVLERALKMPYFGRVDFIETGEKITDNLYIGLASIINREQFEILVTDWRAPAAGMYYDFEVGPASYTAPDGLIEGEVTLKRQFKIKNGKLVLAVDTGIRIDDEILLQTLSKSRNPHMQQIVYSIQREQNRVIRDRSSRYLWIQGVAGSGKTSIALHRIAYLLYHRSKHLKSDNFIVFSPNQVFIDYISDVLPELGEENARQITFFDCAVKTLANYNLQIEDVSEQLELLMQQKPNKRKQIAKYKMSPEFIKVLDLYLQYLKQFKWKFRNVIFAKRKVFTASDAEYLFNQEYAHLPLSERIEQVKNRIVFLISSKYKSVHEEKLKQAVIEAFPKINAFRLYKKLYHNPQLWSEIGVKDLPKKLDQLCRYTVESLNKGKLLYEDVAPLMYMQNFIEGLNIDATVNHVVVDEVQDYTLLQLRLIRAMFADADYTLLGDINQSIHPLNFWQLAEGSKSFTENCKIVELNRCYRSTIEIAELAKFILPQQKLEIIKREGQKPTLHTIAKDNLMPELVNLLRSLSKYESIAVICKTLSRCKEVYKELEQQGMQVKMLTGSSRKFTNGVTILPSYVSKGLEFDAVIVLDADEATYNSKTERRLLYTLTTRALHDLHFFAQQPLRLLQKALANNLLCK